MDFMVIIQCLYLIFTDTLEFSWSQEVYIVRQNMSWENANDSCTLLHGETITNNLLQQGQRAWTGKRILYTDWMMLEDCAQYTLDETLFTTIKLSGVSLAKECYDQCKRLHPTSFVLQFGLFQEDDEDLCLCHNVSSHDPSFGRRVNSCNPINCTRGTDEDLCGDGGLLVYRSYSIDTTNVRGSGDCGSFIRTDNETFNGMAVSCQKELGHLQETANGNYNVKAFLRTWRETVLSEGINKTYPRLSVRYRPDSSVWSRISLTEWPLNVSLWVVWTRRRMELDNKDPFSCLSNRCFCVAVHREKKTPQEDLVDCNAELPSLCVGESVTSTSSTVPIALSTNDKSSTSVFATNATWSKDSKTTKIQTSRTEANGFLVPTAVSLAVSTMLAVVTIVILLIKRKRRRRGKGKTPSIKETQTSYVNTALNVPKEKQESSYETTLICPAEQNYQPLHNLTLQIQPSEHERSIDHKYLTESENLAYEETHVDSYEHVYSKLK